MDSMDASRQLLRASRELLILVEPATLAVTDVNPFTCEILGYRPEEMVGRPITEFECALQDVFYWAEVESGNFREQLDVEGLYACANGDFLPVEKSVRLLADGQPARIAICARDARAAVTAARELSKTTFILQATFESTAEGFLVLDRNGQILNYNRRCMEIWGLDPQGINPGGWVRALTGVARRTRQPAATLAQWRRLTVLASEEETGAVELLDGRAIRCRSRPLIIQDQIEGRVLTFTDITERILRERELAAARDAASASARAKAEFLAMMSHEIRTPLTGILGMTELILETELSSLQREHLSLAHSSAASLLTIINDILDFSRIEAGKLAIENIPFDLAACLRNALGALAWQARARGNRLEFEFPGDQPLWVAGDPTRIQQILINLAGNAIKFTENGRITVGLDWQETEAGAVACAISVRDTGIGIPPEKMALIFDAFTQSDSSISRRFGGTGLGLSISSRLAKLMGGRVEAESTAGAGSCFRLILALPRAAAVAPAAGGSVVRGEPARSLSVLLVEDTQVNQVYISTVLRRAGHGVTICSNGQEAVDLASQPGNGFQVVLMDVQMPVMDGFTATRRLREAGSRLPIIALTAHVTAGFRDECLAKGMSDYLPKPIDSRLLLEKLAQYAAADPTPAPAPVEAAIAEAGGVLDSAAAIDRLGGETDIYLSLLEMVAQQIDEDLASIRAALAKADPASLAAAAHRLKGSLGAIGADPAHTACHRLEVGAKGQEWAAILQLGQALETEIQRLLPCMADYLDKSKV